MNYGQVIAKATGTKLVVYKQFGSYQGDWLIITKDELNHHIYKGCYGSCSGCDSLESFENYEDNFWTMEKVKEFFQEQDYTPFVTVPNEVFDTLVKERNLVSILPANTRLDFDDDDYNDMTNEQVMTKVEEAVLNPEPDEAS